jgi:hypothetical protein
MSSILVFQEVFSRSILYFNLQYACRESTYTPENETRMHGAAVEHAAANRVAASIAVPG